MRYIITICLVITLAGCGQGEKGKTPAADSIAKTDTELLEQILTPQDSVEEAGKLVLLALKNKNWETFSRYFSPTEGIRFSPYGFIDTIYSKRLRPNDFLEAIHQNWILTWGSFDGSGQPIKLTVPAYFKKFVYNADYLNAEKTSYNQIIAKGNSLINLQTVYPGLDFIEYHFSGFDQKYSGMDWSSLRLVFKKELGHYFLVVVIHDQWTI